MEIEVKVGRQFAYSVAKLLHKLSTIYGRLVVAE